MDQAQILGILRGVLAALGGSLVANGVFNDGQLQTIIGAVLTIAPIVWSVVQKHQQNAAVIKAAATGVPAASVSCQLMARCAGTNAAIDPSAAIWTLPAGPVVTEATNDAPRLTVAIAVHDEAAHIEDRIADIFAQLDHADEIGHSRDALHYRHGSGEEDAGDFAIQESQQRSCLKFL